MDIFDFVFLTIFDVEKDKANKNNLKTLQSLTCAVNLGLKKSWEKLSCDQITKISPYDLFSKFQPSKPGKNSSI